MTTIPQLTEQLQNLFTTVANELAKEVGFIRRQRQVTGEGFAQTLVLGSLHQPEATRKQQQQAAARAGIQISSQGLEQRFTPTAVEFMRQLLEAGLSLLINGQHPQPMLPRFNGVYINDCTRLMLGDIGLKMAVRWELQNGQIRASLGELLQHDSKTPVIDEPLPVGALQICDLGFFKLSRLATWNEAGVY